MDGPATNDAGQWSYYGKVGGVVITGNEDGGKHCAAQMMYAMQHIGLAIPPQSDTYWNGEAGPVRPTSIRSSAAKTTRGRLATPSS